MYSISSWMTLHNVDGDLVHDVITAYQIGRLHALPFAHSDRSSGTPASIPSCQSAASSELVIPALTRAFADKPQVRDAIENVQFRNLQSRSGQPPHTPPHTVDNGQGVAPTVFMDWNGTPSDLLCLAHEMAHALQITLSNHAFMPPLAREACAFLGELLLIGYARRRDDPALFDALLHAWKADNAQYLVTDLNDLAVSLDDAEASYHYRLNYPVARLAAVWLFSRGPGEWLGSLFAAGEDAMSHMPLAEMANKAAAIKNYLPPLPDFSNNQIDAYRSLGAMTSLDIGYWQGEPERSIGDYYADLSKHLRDRTAFVALDEQRRPIGYATWIAPPPAEKVTLVRQSAPFGDHLALQHSLERHVGQSKQVGARHTPGTRQEQAAW